MLKLNKENLHHAYLIEGEKEEIFPHIFKFLDDSGISILNNPDFYNLSLDTFKIDDARRLKEISNEKGFSTSKRIFVISFNSILNEAQNALLKLFEEPIIDSHFFILTPDTKSLIPTFKSRFYFLSFKKREEASSEAHSFIKMSPAKRVDFLKDLLKKDEEDDDENRDSLSVKTRAQIFLNELEKALHFEIQNSNFSAERAIVFKKIFFIRKMLRESGGSPKTLMEALALLI